MMTYGTLSCHEFRRVIDAVAESYGRRSKLLGKLKKILSEAESVDDEGTIELIGDEAEDNYPDWDNSEAAFLL